MPIRVAIVDDHRLVVEGLSKVLSSVAGIDVVGACERGEDAAPLVGNLRPDVLLLDIALPDLDGLSVIKSVRDASPDTRILMLSMHSEGEYAAAAIERGAAGLVGKDAAPDRLVEAIRTVAAGGVLPVDVVLTPREREVLEQIGRGLANDEIAGELGISEKTVAGHCERMMQKLDIHTRAGLVAHALRIGL